MTHLSQLNIFNPLQNDSMKWRKSNQTQPTPYLPECQYRHKQRIDIKKKKPTKNHNPMHQSLETSNKTIANAQCPPKFTVCVCSYQMERR